MTFPRWTPASLEGEEWDLVFPKPLREGPP